MCEFGEAELLKVHLREVCICLATEFKYQQSFSRIDDSPFLFHSHRPREQEVSLSKNAKRPFMIVLVYSSESHISSSGLHSTFPGTVFLVKLSGKHLAQGCRSSNYHLGHDLMIQTLYTSGFHLSWFSFANMFFQLLSLISIE